MNKLKIQMLKTNSNLKLSTSCVIVSCVFDMYGFINGCLQGYQFCLSAQTLRLDFQHYDNSLTL